MDPLQFLQPGYDPTRELLNQLQPAALRMLQPPAGGQQPSPIPLLPPDQEDSLLTKVSNGAAGALHFVGSTLDKSLGGRAIRGVLGGHPEELASIVPGSDWMGLSDEKNRVSGEDLLKQAGVLGERDPNQGWLQARDLAGPALEMALDPATYLTFGTGSALTDVGQAAEKAGTLADTAAGRIAAGQSGLVGVGLPFMKPSAVLGTGATGQAIGGLIDKGVDAAAYSYPGRVMSRLFDANVGDTMSEAAQRASRAMNRASPAAEAAARGRFLDVGKTLTRYGLQDRGDELGAVLEGTASAIPGSGMDVAAQLARGHLDAMKQEAQNVGRPVNDLVDDLINYRPRQKTMLNQPTKGFGRGYGPDFPLRSANENARIDPFRDVPGGTTTINAMSVDPAISGPARTLAGPQGNMLNEQAYIRHNYLGGSPADDAEMYALTQKGAARTDAESARLAELNATHQKAGDLAEIMAKLDPQHAEKGLSYFGNNPLSDIGGYAVKHAKAQGAAEAVHDMFARSATVGAATPGAVPIGQALEGAGLTKDILSGGAPTGASATILAKLKAAGVLPATADTAALAGVRVPSEVAADAARFSKGFQVPEALQPLVSGWDYLTNLNKAWQTSFWPATQARNAMTGLWQNMVGGALDPRHSALSPLAHIMPFLDANALRTGNVIEGAASIFPHVAGLTDEAATDMLREEMFQWGARGTGGLAEEAVGLGTHENPGKLVMPNSPEAAQPGLLQAADPRNAIPTKLGDLNPLDVRGVGGRLESGNSLVRYGQGLGEAIDDVNRSSAYIAFRRQGYAPEAALQKATQLHYDYGKLSGFEGQVMRRVAPFYNWSRQNLPFQLQQLLEHPGGLTASALKGTDDLRQKSGFVPDYISEGVSIPVGKEDNGQQRFLTDLGLPFEDLTDVMSGGPNPVARTGEKLLGQLNPMIKGPLEYATGKQFFSDRDLADLYGPTGNIAADQAIMNSPLQRFYGAMHTLTDPRKDLATKALNELAPAKVTDVDMDKARSVSARDLIEETLRHNPNVKNFNELYVKPEDVPNLTPDQFRLMQLYKTLEAAASQKGRNGK